MMMARDMEIKITELSLFEMLKVAQTNYEHQSASSNVKIAIRKTPGITVSTSIYQFIERPVHLFSIAASFGVLN